MVKIDEDQAMVFVFYVDFISRLEPNCNHNQSPARINDWLESADRVFLTENFHWQYGLEK